MNKKLAKFNFVLTGILLVLAIFLCFASFNLPNNKQYYGLFNSISATSEIKEGNVALYKIKTEDATKEDIEATVTQIRNILDGQGFVGSKVYSYGDYIKAEVEQKSNTANILSIIGNSKTFYISETDKTEGKIEESELATYDLTGTDILNAYSTTTLNLNEEYNGVTITFTDAGAEKFHELSRQVGAKENKKVYFYIDGEKSTELEIEETKNNFLSFYSKSYTAEMAQEYALQILMSSTGVELQTISNSTTSATLGNNVLLMLMIAFAIVVLACAILLPILFGDLGFVANISVGAGIVFSIFLLQALPFTAGSLSTIYGAIMGVAIMVICHIIYLNKMKKEFEVLHKLQLSARTAFKKSWLTILDICVITIVSAISLMLWNIPYVSTFATGLAVTSFVALFNSVVLFKDFVGWYVTINKKDYKRVKFTKGENNEN